MLTNERPSSSLPLAPFCVNYSCIFWDFNYFCVSDHTKAEETGDCCQNGPKLVALGFSFSDVGFSYPNVAFRAETREEGVLHMKNIRFTTSIQQLYNNPLYEGESYILGSTLM
jgi:hypothetical protein